MMLSKLSLVTLLPILIVFPAVTLCSQSEDGRRIFSRKHGQTGLPSDADLKKLIEDASEGEGNPTVIEKLKAMSRRDLYHALKRIKKSLDYDDALRMRIAFISCRLGFDYTLNRRILASSLTRKPRYAKFSADEAASLIYGVLLSRRDSYLLRTALMSVDWADGAVTEELIETFYREAQADTTFFLANMRAQSLKRRREVYRLFKGDAQRGNNLKPVQDRLTSIPKTSRLRPIATEMLRAIS